VKDNPTVIAIREEFKTPTQMNGLAMQADKEQIA